MKKTPCIGDGRPPTFNDGNPYFMGIFQPLYGLGLIFPIPYGNVMGKPFVKNTGYMAWPFIKHIEIHGFQVLAGTYTQSIHPHLFLCKKYQ